MQVLADIRKIVGDVDYVPTDPKQLCNTLLVTCYMATENSTAETKSRAADLASQIGAYHHSIVIDTAISAILGIFNQVTKLTPRFKVQGGSPRENLALQNIQVGILRCNLFIFVLTDVVNAGLQEHGRHCKVHKHLQFLKIVKKINLLNCYIICLT